MSVFQLNDWWSTQISSGEEEFDFGCMAVGNLDNASPMAGIMHNLFCAVQIPFDILSSNALCTDKIVIGSQTGMIRIFAPIQPTFRGIECVESSILSVPLCSISPHVWWHVHFLFSWGLDPWRVIWHSNSPSLYREVRAFIAQHVGTGRVASPESDRVWVCASRWVDWR